MQAGLGDLERAEALYRHALDRLAPEDRMGAIAVHQHLAQVLFGEKEFDALRTGGHARDRAAQQPSRREAP